MRTLFFSRRIFTLIALLLISIFTTAQAANDGSLGTWTAKNLPTANYSIQGMAYGNNTYVIVGRNTNIGGKGIIATSPDATTWTIRSTGSTTDQFNSVIFSNGRFIAVCKQPDSGNARIWTSDTNGATWVTRNSDNAGMIVEGGLHSVASDGNGKLVAVGGEKYTSKDWTTISNDNGTTWRVVRSGIKYYSVSTTKFYSVGYAKGIWYASTSGATYQSTDGSSWSPIAGLPGVEAYGLGPKVASNGSTVVIATIEGPKCLTENELGEFTWQPGYKGKLFKDLTTLASSASSVVYAEGLYVLSVRSSNDCDIWVSENGLLWKRWQLPTTSYTNTNALCAAKRAFWCTGESGTISKSPTWFKARTGCSSDYPYTVFDTEDGPPNRIGLPQYRVNTASLNLVLEATLFYAKTLGAPLNFKLVYNSKPTADGDTSIGPFGKNWRFRYESIIGRFGQEAQVINGGGRNHIFVTPNGEDLEKVTQDVTLKAPAGIFDELKYYYNGGVSRFELKLKASHLTYVYGKADTNSSGSIFHLTAIKDQFEKTTTLNVDDTAGLITWLQDHSGRTFNFTYDPISGLCSEIAMSGGRTVSFTYDDNKNLTDIHDMMNYHGHYAYDANGFMTSMTTAGKTNTFTYEIRPGCEEDPLPDQDQYLASVTRADGKKIKYELQDEGEKVKRTDAAGQISYFTNKDGQTTTIIDPLGNVRSISYNGAKLPETVTDEKGGKFTYKYDAKGNMTEKKDALGNVTKYTHDASNNVTGVENALGQKWTYTYSNYMPTSVKTPLDNHTTNIAYGGTAPSGSRIESITDARGNSTSFGYDAYGNLTRVSPPAAGTIFFTYSDGFRCTGITDGNNNSKTIAWDKNDRLTTVTYAGGVSYANAYNAFGQTDFTDEMGQTTSIVRDELGYITSITDPLGNITQTEYDADNRPIKTTDPLGRASLTTYDKDGRPTVFTDAKGYTITRGYDGVGNLISFKDKNNSETTYTYDANNRLLNTSDPLKKITAITRDELGRVKTSKNARGKTVTFAYDAEGQISGKTYDDTTPAITYSRDENGNITSQKDAWGTTNETATKYEYDSCNRVTKITYPDGKTVDLTYDNLGKIATITYPDNSGSRLVATYTYDTFNRQPIPSVLKNNPGTDLAGESRSSNAITAIDISGGPTGSYGLTYNNRGNILRITRPNGIETGFTYDNAGRITQVKHSETAGGGNLFTANYTPDALGNISSESFTGSAYYSSMQILSNAALLYNAAGELTKNGTKACVSDADGNLIDVGAGTVKYAYDAENRLTQIDKKAGTVITTTKNTYNADGQRVRKEVTGNAAVLYHYLPSGALLFTSDASSGAIIDQHIHAGSALLSTYKANGDWLHYFADRQGHVRFIADNTQPTGAVIAKYDYLPYGQVIHDPANDANITNHFTYVGGFGVQDEGDGLFYMRNRFYDASSGRFLQRDPIGFEGGSNLHAYANGNPLRYIDPNGTDSIGEWLWWGAVETAKVGVAVAAGTAAVVVVGVSTPAAIAIGATVYVGEQGVHAMYNLGKTIEDAKKTAPNSSESDEESQGNGDAAITAQGKSEEQQEAIKKLGEQTTKQVGNAGPTL